MLQAMSVALSRPIPGVFQGTFMIPLNYINRALDPQNQSMLMLNALQNTNVIIELNCVPELFTRVFGLHRFAKLTLPTSDLPNGVKLIDLA